VKLRIRKNWRVPEILGLGGLRRVFGGRGGLESVRSMGGSKDLREGLGTRRADS